MASTPNPLAPSKLAKRVVIAVKVKFELNSRSGLRRVIFGLEKDTNGDLEIWKIQFQLFERDRKTDPYDDHPMIDLEIEVDTALTNKAQNVADNGLTPGQAGHALGPAAEDAKAAQAGDLDQSEADTSIQATLKKK